ATSESGTSGSVTIAAGAATKLLLAGAGRQTAGSANALTLTAQDASGNTATGYSGDKSLTFSGANASGNPVTQPTVTDKTGAAVNFGTATTITFTNGVSSAGGSMVLYKAETATIVATQGGITTTGADRLTVTVNNAADGSGTLTSGTSSVLAGSTGNTISFTYTAATGGMTSGGVKLTVPTGWTAPQTGAGAGQVTASSGSVSVSGQTVTVDLLSLAGGATVTITYSNGVAPTTTGSQTWSGQQRSTGGGSYTALASSPSISVDNAADGSGTLSTGTTNVVGGSTDTVSFTYTAATGGVTNGGVKITVPSGWTAPQTAAGAGQVTAGSGTVSVYGQTITVDSLSLAGGAAVTITY